MPKHAKPGPNRSAYATDVHLAAHFGVSRASIWRWVKSDPTFPAPVKLSPQVTRWKWDDVQSWEAAQSAT